jgi:hypothetical protein
MTTPRMLGDVWAGTFAAPSKLWQPAPDLKPHEWTPLSELLERAKERVGLDQAGFELREHFATGRIKTALHHLYETKMSRLFLQPPFWEPLEFRRGQGGFIRPEGDVMGQPVFHGGSWAFFVRTAEANKFYPVAVSTDARSEQANKATSHRPPGKRPAKDWKAHVEHEIIRRGIGKMTAEEWCQFCEDTLNHQPDPSDMRKLLRHLLNK